MSLIIASGSNQGNSVELLAEARDLLSKDFTLVAQSRIYTSRAVDYEAQPDFFNQVLEFELPGISPDEVMEVLLRIEHRMGRRRIISRGPRTIDLDVIFWGLDAISTPTLIVPHPRWSERSFVVRPLGELPFFQTIKKCFTIPETFTVEATPIN